MPRRAHGVEWWDGPAVETFTGLYLDLEDPHPSDIRLSDVAHGLAHTCRFGGQASRFYSVAQHAALVAARLVALGQSKDVALAGLHHDDPEAYLGDITRPLKTLAPEFRQIETRLWVSIAEALELPGLDITSDAVKEADNWALAHEAYYLLPSRGRPWATHGRFAPGEDPGWSGTLSPESAELLWLEVHHALSTPA